MSAPQYIGVDVGGTSIRAARFAGHSHVPVAKTKVPTQAAKGAEVVLQRLEAAIRQTAGHELDNVAGVGIAAAGPLNPHTGVVLNAPNLPGWQNLPLKQLMEDRLHRPVFIGNDANLAALGEWKFGAARDHQDVLYLTISTGIGGGVIIDGKIVEGAKGTAGELGHMTIDWRGERCNCGNIGCLEYIASGTGIARAANEAIRSAEGIELLAFARTLLEHSGEEELQIDAQTVALAAEAGVPLARAIIQNAAEAIGAGLVNIIHCFNPEMIILGGGVIQMGPMLMEPALRVVQERAMKVPRESVRIVQAQLGANAGLIGAGALIYYYNDAYISG